MTQYRLPRWQRIDSRFLAAVRGVERRFGSVAVALLVALAANLVSVFVAASLTSSFESRFTLIAANPFARGDIGLETGLRMRILGPCIAWVLGLRGTPSTLIPALAAIPLLMLLYDVLARHTSRRAAVLATLLMALTHLTIESRTILGYQDSLVFLFILLAMATRRVGLGASSLYLAAFGDQRALLAVPFLLVWHSLFDDGDQPLRRTATRAAAYGLAIGAWFASTALLMSVVGQSRQAVDSMAMHLKGGTVDSIKPGYLQLSYFMAFKAAWVFPVIAVWLWLGPRFWRALVVASTILAILLASLLVQDTARTAAFCFPAVILGILALWERDKRKCIDFLMCCVLINLLTPFYHGMSHGLGPIFYPLPIEIVLRVLHALKMHS